MEHISVTTLRTNIYKLVDRVLATGEPLVIERGGKHVYLTSHYTAPVEVSRKHKKKRAELLKAEQFNKLSRFTPHPEMAVDDLEGIEKISVWDEEAWLAKWDAWLRE